MLALGQLDGALEHADASALRIFAARLVRDALCSALRQEGHGFTDQRFQAWFAGLATLADTPPRGVRPPRVLCEAILTQLAHAGWPPLAAMAVNFGSALLAPRDLTSHGDHEQAHAAISNARLLVTELAAEPGLPLAALAALHDAVAASTRFAPAERGRAAIALDRHRKAIERDAPPSPRWAVELLFGECLRAGGALRQALPLPGIVRLDALGAEGPAEARTIRASALHEIARDMAEKLREAARLSRRAAQRPAGVRGTSRAPLLHEILAGFGAMRSAQIESALGASRLGVRGMLATLEAMGVLERSTIAGVRLYSVSTTERPALGADAPDGGFTFSSSALDDYEASLASLDRLLARSDEGMPDKLP